MDTELTHHRRVATLLRLQVEIQDVLHKYATETFLPLPVAKRFAQTILDLLREYSKLANWADAESKLLFNLAPKFHWLFHMGDRAAYLNPRRGCTMVDEDYVGKLKDLVAACAPGCEAHTVPIKVMERYRWGKFMSVAYDPID